MALSQRLFSGVTANAAAPAASPEAAAPASVAAADSEDPVSNAPAAAHAPATASTAEDPVSNASADAPAAASEAAPSSSTLEQANAPAKAEPGPIYGLEDGCPVCFEELSAEHHKPWAANCGHVFCPRCAEACLARSLKCPVCRSEAPASAKPPPSRRQVLLTAAHMIRLRELEQLRAEQETQRPGECTVIETIASSCSLFSRL